ncbi:hypothetical protein EON66_11700 [archaeon]|nr:MAG: hypothetical protein EON66_11700 [archaeon]
MRLTADCKCGCNQHGGCVRGRRCCGRRLAERSATKSSGWPVSYYRQFFRAPSVRTGCAAAVRVVHTRLWLPGCTPTSCLPAWRAFCPSRLLCRHFPTTHIIVGGLDPLLDDAVDFNTRLRRLSVPGDLQVHRTLPHGFLNFQFLTHAQRAVAMVEEYVLRVLA